jgi:flagellar assembly protein FliH
VKEYAFEQLEPSAPQGFDGPGGFAARAQAEAERLYAQAQREGFQKGYEDGHEQGVAAVRSSAAALASALDEWLATREALTEALEQDAVELALALAAKVLAGTLELQPERVVDVVRGALRHIADRRTITIVVDPADMEIVNSALGELRAQTGGIEHCEVQADRRVGPGGAIVRTTEGEVDACLDTQLAQARDVVAAELGTDSRALTDDGGAEQPAK